jgi:hypothetical protein
MFSFVSFQASSRSARMHINLQTLNLNLVIDWEI